MTTILSVYESIKAVLTLKVMDLIDARRAHPAGVKSQTIERASLILACFSAEEPRLTLEQLAGKLGLSQSTVYRYVATLHATGLLQRDEQRGGYQLGLRVLHLAGIAVNQLEVRKHALEEMDQLQDQINLLVSLGVLFEGDVMHVATSVPANWPRWYLTLGRRAVAHCTTMGKVLLAHRPWEDVVALINEYGWRPYTPHSIHDFDTLKTELSSIRVNDYAVDNEERRVGMICLGTPIRDGSQAVIAALSVTGTVQRLPPSERDAILQQLRATADRISFRLGNHASTAFLG